jgi:hypothetical protein
MENRPVSSPSITSGRSTDVNEAEAHRFFSAQCFNRAWDLIRKRDRTDLENEQMLLLSQASLWHWTQRSDCTPRHLSIGYWQLSRVQALLGQAENALDSAKKCLRYSENTSPFFVGYAHEALARSAAIAGDDAAKGRHLAEARRCLSQVASERDSALLGADLQSLASE